mmetsp:Transcript_16786/g.47951  ORF Transcript_16786/g.47951 Transcript_16786/m.47951 type:complete len:234 (+) Transcript_16786:129-830(+)
MLSSGAKFRYLAHGIPSCARSPARQLLEPVGKLFPRAPVAVQERVPEQLVRLGPEGAGRTGPEDECQERWLLGVPALDELLLWQHLSSKDQDGPPLLDLAGLPNQAREVSRAQRRIQLGGAEDGLPRQVLHHDVSWHLGLRNRRLLWPAVLGAQSPREALGKEVAHGRGERVRIETRLRSVTHAIEQFVEDGNVLEGVPPGGYLMQHHASTPNLHRTGIVISLPELRGQVGPH